MDPIVEFLTDHLIIIGTFFVGALILPFFIMRRTCKKEDELEEHVEVIRAQRVEEKVAPARVQPKAKPARQKTDSLSVNFNHIWLICSLKSHTSKVFDFDCSANGKYVATCSEDRTVLLWRMKEFSEKEKRIVRANVEYDHAIRVAFSPDSKAFIVALHRENAIRVFRLGKKEDGQLGNITAAIDFQSKHEKPIIALGIACTGKFIMTASSDTTIYLWTVKGEELEKLDSHQVNNSFAAVSPCGRFVACAGFTPMVRVWEVCFDKDGNYKGAQRAFELKGHSAGLLAFDFNGDSTRMASLSKDNTWRLWDIQVEYRSGQDPRQLTTGSCPGGSLIALSPDARVIAVAHGTSVSWFRTRDSHLEETMHDIHASPINTIKFTKDGRYLLTTGDRHVRVFHNVPGYRELLIDYSEKLKSPKLSQAQRSRIKEQIEEAETALKQILGAVQEVPD